jgi:uncharacterized DUF497 family protein
LPTRITFDPAKREATLRDRQVDFLDAELVFEGPKFMFPDERFAYPEPRFVTIGLLAVGWWSWSGHRSRTVAASYR